MSAMKGRLFCDFTEIMKNATDELKRLSRKGFQHFYCCWQKCVVTKVDYFEGNVPYIFLIFCISQKSRDSWKNFELSCSSSV